MKKKRPTNLNMTLFTLIGLIVCVCTNAINAEDTLCVRPYIVKIEDSDQDAKRHDADAACYQTIKSKENESITQDPLKCPIIFDTVTCWPQADVNTTFSLPCPNYINKFNTKNQAFKSCLYDNQSQRAFWSKTFYHSCLSYDKKDYCNITSCSLENHMKYIVIIRVCGYMASMVSLLLSIVILLRPKMRCPRNYVHVNLFCAFVARTILVMIVDTVNNLLQEYTSANSISSGATHNPRTMRYLVICRSIVSIFRYTGSVYYMAIFAEAIYLVLLLKFPYYNESKGCKFCIIISWTLPIIWMTPWIFTRVYVDNYWCWQAESGVNLILKIPHSIILVSNICCAVFIIRILYSKMRVRRLSREKVMKYRRLAKSILILIPIFGLHFILFAWVPYVSMMKLEMTQCFEIFITYVETFFNAFQGFVVSITCCFMHKEAQFEFSVLVLQIMRKLKCINGATYHKCIDSDYMRKLRNNDLRGPLIANAAINVDGAANPLIANDKNHHASTATNANNKLELKNDEPNNQKNAKTKKKLRINEPLEDAALALKKQQSKSDSVQRNLSRSNSQTSSGLNNRKCRCCCECLFGNQKNDFFVENGRHSRAFSAAPRRISVNSNGTNATAATANARNSVDAGILTITTTSTTSPSPTTPPDSPKITHLQLTRSKQKQSVSGFVEVNRERDISLKLSSDSSFDSEENQNGNAGVSIEIAMEHPATELKSEMSL